MSGMAFLRGVMVGYLRWVGDAHTLESAAVRSRPGDPYVERSALRVRVRQAGRLRYTIGACFWGDPNLVAGSTNCSMALGMETVMR
jgi:hypothetical protein